MIFSLASSLTATLEYVEEKTNVDSVFVNFQNNQNDRGEDLLCPSRMLVLVFKQLTATFHWKVSL